MVKIKSLVPIERDVFLREENSGLYRISSYFVGKLVVEIPLLVVSPTLFALGCLWTTGLNTDSVKNILVFSKFQYYQIL